MVCRGVLSRGENSGHARIWCLAPNLMYCLNQQNVQYVVENQSVDFRGVRSQLLTNTVPVLYICGASLLPCKSPFLNSWFTPT